MAFPKCDYVFRKPKYTHAHLEALGGVTVPLIDIPASACSFPRNQADTPSQNHVLTRGEDACPSHLRRGGTGMTTTHTDGVAGGKGNE